MYTSLPVWVKEQGCFYKHPCSLLEDIIMNIAIIDSGINIKNQKVAHAILEGISISSGNESSDYMDSNGHGTYCAEIITRICPKAKLIIVKILNRNNQGSSECLLRALEYLEDKDVDIINMSLSTYHNDFREKLQKKCDILHARGVVLVSSLANHAQSSYPAIFSSVLGVRGELFLGERDYIYSPHQSIQCIASSVPVLVDDIDGKYSFFGGNSKATAIVTGILGELLSRNNKKKDINTLIATNSDCIKNKNLDISLDIDKKINLPEALYKEAGFKKLINIVKNCLDISENDENLLFENSLLNPIFHATKKDLGSIISAIESEWKISFNKENITLLNIETIDKLYSLITRTLCDKYNSKK